MTQRKAEAVPAGTDVPGPAHGGFGIDPAFLDKTGFEAELVGATRTSALDTILTLANALHANARLVTSTITTRANDWSRWWRPAVRRSAK